MAFTEYLRDRVLDQLFGKVDYDTPTTLYVSLSTTSPNSEEGITEPSGNNYSRVGISNDKNTFGVSNEGQLTNAKEIEFSPASEEWGEIAYFAIYDSITDGNELTSGHLTNSKVIEEDDQVVFPEGSLVIMMD